MIMKKIVLGLGLLLTAQLWGQMDVSLQIHHKLGTEPFMLDATAENNLGDAFQATRLEYYISQFSIIHDGGTVTDVSLDVIDLVNPGEETETIIPLGNFDVTDVESIRFYIGVQTPENNEDPTLWPEDHPLAPKSPSMHWGWAAGYRFIAYEGMAGDGFAQIFQMHGLGNSNYFRTEVDVETEMVDGVLMLNITGDYTEGLRDIELSGGVISHGEAGAAKQTLENWRDYVFENNTAGIDNTDRIDFHVFPNPASNELVNVQFDNTDQVERIEVMNQLGQVILRENVIGTNLQLEIPDAGVYFINVIGKDDQFLGKTKLVVQ